MIKVSVVGGSGYTGAELLRLLAGHPEFEVVTVTSRTEAGRPLGEQYPNLLGRLPLTFSEVDIDLLAASDLVCFATPNGVAMELAPELLARGCRVVDLAADFRLRDAALWSQWYGQPHACPELLDQSVYGLPELNRSLLPDALLVACPGCYPTSVTLGLMPLLEAGLVETDSLIADVKSGVSGAGRGAKVNLLLCEAAENFKAYGVFGHRHHPEIAQTLAQVAGCGGDQVGLIFTPHLVPMIRGIHATLYGRLHSAAVGEDVQALYEARYEAEQFVQVLPAGSYPETRHVAGTNQCRVALHRDGERLIVLSVIDNLGKGAAGQAVQCMNLMCGLPEESGLSAIALLP